MKRLGMIKKIFFSLLLHFSLLPLLISQVEYTVTIRGNAHNGYPSSLLADNEFVFSTYNMRHECDYERDYSGIAKIDAKGKIVDSLMFFPQSDTITYVWDIQKTSQIGVYSGCGIKRCQNKKNHVWLFEFDNQMQLLWEKIIDTLNFAPMRMEHHAIGENRYMFCSSSSEGKNCFYNFNKTTGSIIKNNSYGGWIDYLCPIPPENNTFLINDSDSRKTTVIDSAFEKIKDAVIFANRYYQPPDCEFINDTQFVVVRRNLVADYGPISLVMAKVDISSMDVLATKHFAGESFGEVTTGMLGIHKSLAVQKDYFFVFGASLLQVYPTPVAPFDNNLFLYAFNHSVDSIWSIHLDFDAYYWPFSIASTPDGGCVIGATRYDWREEGNYFCDAFMVKIKPNFPTVSIPEVENPVPLVSVFPNPGDNRFFIQTEFARFTLHLYNLQGQLLLTQQNQKEVDMENFPSCCYIYRIIAENGTTTNGKWVKK